MTPEEMEKLPKKLEKIFSNLELDVMADIVERLKETKDITPTIDWLLLRMSAIGKSKSAIKRAIQKALDLAEKEIDAIYQKAAESLFARDAGIYKAAGKDFVTLKENDEVLQLIDAIKRQTAEEMTNITRSTGFMTRNEKGEKVMTSAAEFFQQKLDQAILEIDTGTYDYYTSIQKVIDEMTTSGLRTVEYASGRMARVEVAARRAVMTGNSQLTDKINEKNAELLETEYWEVAWHMGARNTGTGYRNHQSWQGKVYSNEEMKTICGLGEMLGFGGINCYHIRYPFVPGVSKRNYTDEWLEEQNKKENTKKPYKGKEYDTYAALQHQRKLERTMRKQNQ
ncbi:MAG: phage minor capsid protein, partial [Clostridium sp.]|nr:phage minor capsid protein [Clostridium sp.]